jgi:hypothetical protein
MISVITARKIFQKKCDRSISGMRTDDPCRAIAREIRVEGEQESGPR